MSKPYFTYDELFHTFLHITSQSDADEMARDIVSSLAETTELGDLATPSQGLAYRTVANSQLTDDTLILLSVQSDSLAAKVEAFRREFRFGVPETRDEKEEWARRRAEIQAWANAGYPRYEDDDLDDAE